MMAEVATSAWQRLRYTRFRDVLRGRLDASLDWRRVLAEAELPAELRHLVAETVEATRLWNSEKVDVTRELVSHFQDGLERGREAPVLAATFGDTPRTAALIRRAKKRGRSLVWYVWHYGWILCVAATLAYVLVGLWMMTSRPTVNVDYLAIINKEALNVPANERAWPLYRAALLELGTRSTPGEFYPSVVMPLIDARPGEDDWPKMRERLGKHSSAVAKLREAAARPGLGFIPATSFVAFDPEDRRLFDVQVSVDDIKAYESQTLEDRWLVSTLLPNLQPLRLAASVLGVDARRAAEDRDGKTALADVVALWGASRHAVETPFLVNLLVSVAIQNMACDTVHGCLSGNPELWSAAELRALAHTIAATPVDWRRGITGETAGFQDAMQRLYTDDGTGDGRLAFRASQQQNVFQLLDAMIGPGQDDASYYANDGLAMLMLPVANSVIASRKEMTDTYESFVNSAVTKISTPLWKQGELTPLDDSLLTERAGALEKYRYMFVRLLVPAFDAVRNRLATLEGKRDGVLIGIALELYRRENRAWPKSLADLSPRWLPAVPVDRVTGEPLGYKVDDDKVVVYSRGVDRDDDGGTAPTGESGELDSSLASPNHFQLEPVLGSMHDGDWVIWSTARGAG